MNSYSRASVGGCSFLVESFRVSYSFCILAAASLVLSSSSEVFPEHRDATQTQSQTTRPCPSFSKQLTIYLTNDKYLMTKKSLGHWLYSAAHRFRDWALLFPASLSRAVGCEFLQGHLPAGGLMSGVPRDFPSLFLVCRAIMASRFSAGDGGGRQAA